jgi:WD40 repeat protein
LKGHTEEIKSIFTSSDNPWIISFANGGILRVWSSDTGKCHQILTGHNIIAKFPSQNSCGMSLNHELVASIAGMKGETKLWDITNGKCTLTIPNISGIGGWRHHIVYLSSKRLVWWQSDIQSGEVGVWNLQANKHDYTLPFEMRIKLVSVSADGKYLIIVFNEYESEYAFVQVHDFETGALIESTEKKNIL